MKQIKPYMDQQIKHEDKYYQEFGAILGSLIADVLNRIKLKDKYPRMPVNIASLYTVYNSWFNRYSSQLSSLARDQAVNILNIATGAIKDDSDILSTTQNYLRVTELNHEINVVQANSINAAWGLFVGLIPVGITNLYDKFFTDEVTQEDIYRRANNYLKRTCRDIYGQGVFNSIALEASLSGYTEYLGENQKDSRVREMHRKYFNGENWIRFDSPPPCGHIATEDNCRCYIIAVR